MPAKSKAELEQEVADLQDQLDQKAAQEEAILDALGLEIVEDEDGEDDDEAEDDQDDPDLD